MFPIINVFSIIGLNNSFKLYLLVSNSNINEFSKLVI